MDETESLFKNWFQPRLEYQISRTPPILSDHQKDQVNRWAELLAETDKSLQTRSKQRKSVRRRARAFAKNAHIIAAELFILCSLSFTISALPSIPDGSFYDYLRIWWTTQNPPTSLIENAKHVCQGMPSGIKANKAIAADSVSPTVSNDFTFRPETETSQGLSNLGDTPQGGLLDVISTGKSHTDHKL